MASSFSIEEYDEESEHSSTWVKECSDIDLEEQNMK